MGDFPDSYAYDGKRIKRWSVSAAAYGQAWAAGDILGSCIDLEAGTVSYYRNGAPLGVAFTGLRRLADPEAPVPWGAYFPAASLSRAERATFNFGALPFAHPVQGHLPLQVRLMLWCWY